MILGSWDNICATWQRYDMKAKSEEGRANKVTS